MMEKDVERIGFERTGELLAEVAVMGSVAMFRNGAGTWAVSVEFPAPDGVTAKCHSGYDHPSPDVALLALLDRVGGLRDMVAGASFAGTAALPAESR